jgi:ketosteroid isomerase-like protein
MEHTMTDATTTTPDVINRYLTAAAAGDLDTLVDCFTEDGFVIDEGQRYTGHEEILGWRNAVASAFTYTTTVEGSTTVGPDRYRVATHIVGNFPGGEAHLAFDFELAGDSIAALVIAG